MAVFLADVALVFGRRPALAAGSLPAPTPAPASGAVAALGPGPAAGPVHVDVLPEQFVPGKPAGTRPCLALSSPTSKNRIPTC